MPEYNGPVLIRHREIPPLPLNSLILMTWNWHDQSKGFSKVRSTMHLPGESKMSAKLIGLTIHPTDEWYSSATTPNWGEGSWKLSTSTTSSARRLVGYQLLLAQ